MSIFTISPKFVIAIKNISLIRSNKREVIDNSLIREYLYDKYRNIFGSLKGKNKGVK